MNADDLRTLVSETETLDSVVNEKKRIIEDEDNGMYCDGLRILGISKIYRKLPFGFSSVDDVLAV